MIRPLVFCLIALGDPAQAAFDCRFDTRLPRMPQALAIGSGAVGEGVSLTVEAPEEAGHPAFAAVEADDDAETRFFWTAMARVDGEIAVTGFTLTLQKADGTAMLRYQAVGSALSFPAKGTCTPR